LSLTNPRDIDLQATAQIDGGGVQVGLGHGCPQVKLVARRAALETPEGVSPEMN
jgi:hypothetical protein